ncbi:MAG TPA: hypothetical protein VFF52_26960 [Isosphaeraceae bacterium]|nr:hypothetical protein [Isosphaeraceae bacterium]
MSADEAQPNATGAIDYVEPMPAAAQSPSSSPLPEGVPAPAPAAPGRSSGDPAMEDFDAALAQVAASLLMGRPGSSRAEPLGPGPARGAWPVWGLSTLVGTAALAVGGSQLVLREPDERTSRWWSYLGPRRRRSSATG